jgi:hypothetical protein
MTGIRRNASLTDATFEFEYSWIFSSLINGYVGWICFGPFSRINHNKFTDKASAISGASCVHWLSRLMMALKVAGSRSGTRLIKSI